jgi:hypothetical protein
MACSDPASPDPGGPGFVLTLKPDEQSSTKADIAALEQRLQHIEAMLSARR